MNKIPVLGFVVDTEVAPTRNNSVRTSTPESGTMTEFALIPIRRDPENRLVPEDFFYARLYATYPNRDIPAVPMLRRDPLQQPVQSPRIGTSASHTTPVDSIWQVAQELVEWRYRFTDGSPLISDNIAFDGMFLNCFTDRYVGYTLFGHSGRRIGDFAAGLSGDWKNHNKWKKLRHTAHTHSPDDDALGNAEALITLLDGES